MVWYLWQVDLIAEDDEPLVHPQGLSRLQHGAPRRAHVLAVLGKRLQGTDTHNKASQGRRGSTGISRFQISIQS